MRKLLFLLLIDTLVHADFFTDQLVVKEEKIDARYYKLLPIVDEIKPDLTFIRSREPTTMSLEESFLEMIEAACVPSVFIETGTFLGDTTSKALIFPQVMSIELDSLLFQQAQQRFKNNTNIHLYEGDTVKLLPRILTKVKKEKPVIFLDAHYSLGNTAKGDCNTPILGELHIIKKSGITNAILIIDDIRMFYTPLTCVSGTFMEGYPTLNTIIEAVLDINADYQCAVIYDTLIAFSAQEKVTVSPVVRAVTMSRLYDGTNYEIDDVLIAELAIAKAQGDEQKAVLDLGARWVEKWSEAAGLSGHCALWSGLIYLANENYDAAHAYLKEAYKRGLHNWRIEWYCALAQAQLFFGYR